MSELASRYLEEISRQLRGHKRMAESAMAQVESKDFFHAIDSESNSVAVLVKHIAGIGSCSSTTVWGRSIDSGP